MIHKEQIKSILVQKVFMISKELYYLKNPSLDFKKNFVMGSYESLAMLVGKTRKGLFF